VTTQYEILVDKSHTSLTIKVNAFLEQDWKLLGQPFMGPQNEFDSKGKYCQCLIREV
jgi:hypothetical protein